MALSRYLILILALLAGLSLTGFIAPLQLENLVNVVYLWIDKGFTQYYLLFGFLAFCAMLAIAFSPLGKTKLGGENVKPEFSLLSWFVMLFGAGMGTGLLYWGAAEPLFHAQHPPIVSALGIESKMAMAYQLSFLHWGFIPWAIYALAAVIYSTQFSRFDKALPNWITAMTVLAIIFGVVASFGMAIFQLKGGLETLWHTQLSVQWTLGLLVCGFFGFVCSALQGVQKGIQKLSELNFIAYILLLLIILSLPHGTAHWGIVWKAWGQSILSLPQMSLGLLHYQHASWPSAWTAKYWSWWLAWAPFVGLFISMISKGRTVKQVLLCGTIFPTLFCMVWFSIMGHQAISQLYAGDHHWVVTLNNSNQVLFQLVSIHPWASAVMGLCLCMIAIDFINSADSATYTLASLSSSSASAEPSNVLKWGWGIVFCILTGAFILTDGISVLQKITNIFCLPYSFIFAALIGLTLWRAWGLQKIFQPQSEPPSKLPQASSASF
jgi:glycine betaine transporter